MSSAEQLPGRGRHEPGRSTTAASGPPGPSAATAPLWHTLEAADVVSALASDAGVGLSATEAERRLIEYGANVLPVQPGRSVWRMIVDQVADPMIALLVVAAVVSGIVGEPADTIVITVIVLLNAVIGVVQERRAEQAMAALRAMSAPSAEVVRDGVEQQVDAAQLVPGDLVVLADGAIVPADLRLVSIASLRVAEAALTGESQPVSKRVEPVTDPHAPIGDRRSMAFRGTFVTQGRGRGVVVGTGTQTELGAIADLLMTADVVRTPLQRRLSQFGGRIALAVVAICAVVFGTGLLRGEDPGLMFLTAISLAVAAVPEALPAVVAVTLALGARRMAHHNALVRRLPAVETLGSVTWICSDKTGTLTENRMRVEVLDVGSAARLPDSAVEAGAMAALLDVLVLCNDATLGAGGSPATGDPTEIALLEAARDRGVDPEARRAARPRIDEVPFDSGRKLMVTIHDEPGVGRLTLVKGAPEAIVTLCALSGSEQSDVLAHCDALAARGLRVLAAAHRVDDPSQPHAPGWAAPPDIPHQLTLLGVVGMIDPPRQEAPAAVAECRVAGITPVMITGDHPATAAAIARRLGILEAGDDEVLTGPALTRLDDSELAEVVGRVRVYARVDPEQKIRIVRALQAEGQSVAMTGDGVNDAPALRQAEIGVAMGLGGTDVAREAADMVLLDDRFATIVTAVREGRRIYDDIRKFIRYALTGNTGEIWVVFLAPFLGMPVPLLPIHILWVNLITDGLPGLALAEEPAERDVMARPPRPPEESIFARGLGIHVLWVGGLIAALTLGTQAWALSEDTRQWQSMVFTVLVFCQLVHSMAIRSESRSLFRMGLLTNRALLGAIVLSVLLQLALLYVPWLQGVFRTTALTPAQLAVVFLVPLVVLVAVEIEKLLVRRGVLRYGEVAVTPGTLGRSADHPRHTGHR
ncbi:MAG TPA: cation-translocating P-type ATPase [Candidatus Limnocylindrales bacterium]|nr:cation-translocating P-type ATPase [Candidatus Limnocylindrales bacterium]